MDNINITMLKILISAPLNGKDIRAKGAPNNPNKNAPQVGHPTPKAPILPPKIPKNPLFPADLAALILKTTKLR